MTYPGPRLLTVIPHLERTRAIGRLLTLLGYEVLGAADVSAAGLLAAHTRPAAVLVDATLTPAEAFSRLRVRAPRAAILAIDTLADAAAGRRWAAADAYCATLPDSAALELALARLCPAQQGGPRPTPWAVVGLMNALASHDPAAARHARRVAALSLAVGGRLGLSREELRQLGWGALLHEIGRVALATEDLGPLQQLTPHQRQLRRQLPHLALQVVGALELGPLAFAVIGGPACCPEHCEPPQGAVSLAQRVAAAVDAFDTLAGARPTPPAVEAALAQLEARRGWDGAVLTTIHVALATVAPNPGERAVGQPAPTTA